MIEALEDASADAVTLHLLTPETLAATPHAAWAEAADFAAAPGALLPVMGADGALAAMLAGRDPKAPPLWAAAGLPKILPARQYRLTPEPDAAEASELALGWALGCYRFARYKPAPKKLPTLAWPAQADRAHVERLAEAVVLVRDLVNTPANDMGPAELAEAARALASRFGAECRVTEGAALLEQNYPAIHAVGRASTRAPRLIDLVWGEPAHPKVTLVGKGVCFDTGGLDLKPSSAMLMMKKDMGGAAHALGVALAVMAAGLKVRLRVLIPAVENAVAGNAMRPLDVVRTRKGLTVEIGNTDAEGRVILADALAEACSEQPALLIDFATLTGAARVALGPELPALFCNDEALAGELLAAAGAVHDPLWRLPLWQPYKASIESELADLNNAGSLGQAGAITAALFLESFVEPDVPWAHLDTYAWNAKSRPGRPEGGEALGLRAVVRLIEARFS